MKNYIALKPCRFQGVNYKIGEKISEEIIGKKAIGGLISMEFIKEIPTVEKICSSTKNSAAEKVSEEKISPQKTSEPEENISTTEEIKKSKKKSKIGEENDVQLQS